MGQVPLSLEQTRELGAEGVREEGYPSPLRQLRT